MSADNFNLDDDDDVGVGLIDDGCKIVFLDVNVAAGSVTVYLSVDGAEKLAERIKEFARRGRE